jgi:transcriptional regulator with GAF, ATPase, and Fis domain
MICTPLVLGTTVLGSLSLGSTAVNAFDEESASLAAIFAAHTATALAAAEGRRQLSAAISSRDVIGQAKGILMERYRIGADAAFAVLVRTSQHTNVKLHDVAVELCEGRSMPRLPPHDAVGVGHTDGQADA